MKAIGYVRVSTNKQAEEGVSLAAQEAKIKAWADLNGEYSEVQIFRDEGISGKRADNREGLQDALSVIGKGDALIVYSLSRLSRSTKDTLALAEALRKKEADLVSISEKIDTTSAAGKMVFRLLAVLNEFERDQIADRTRAALQYKKSRGEKTGGGVPFGFKVRKGRLYADRKEQEAVSMIKTLRTGGKSLRGICRVLEGQGYRRKEGASAWHPQAVLRIAERELIAA